MNLTPEIEAKCLALGDPDDFGEDCYEFRHLSNSFVNGKRWHPCAYCGRLIRPGERQRSIRVVIDGEVFGCRYCDVCCEAWVVYESAHGNPDTMDDAWNRYERLYGFGKALEPWLSIGPRHPHVNA